MSKYIDFIIKIFEDNKIHYSWYAIFLKNKKRLYKIYQIISTDIFYPSENDIFKVFQMPINEIKLLILSQDPYIKENQATGLAFSVPSNHKIPPSLQNIFKEINIEYNNKYKFIHGDLTKWFEKEKIFLLNSSLTVIPNKSGSHMKLWEKFTDNIIKYINKNNQNVIYLLLGNFAKSKSKYITNTNNIVFGIHPSPLSCYQGFFNSNIFIKVNNLLEDNIDWQN